LVFGFAHDVGISTIADLTMLRVQIIQAPRGTLSDADIKIGFPSRWVPVRRMHRRAELRQGGERR